MERYSRVAPELLPMIHSGVLDNDRRLETDWTNWNSRCEILNLVVEVCWTTRSRSQCLSLSLCESLSIRGAPLTVQLVTSSKE